MAIDGEVLKIKNKKFNVFTKKRYSSECIGNLQGT